MSQHKDLQKAIRQMADGSKSGFYTFYLGSAQFVYNSALLLYGEHKASCNFMVDFYQYLYLHLPEYHDSLDLEKWISRLIMERFQQLSIGKNIKKPSVQEQMSAGNALFGQAERERVWRLLEERMHFPPEVSTKKHRSRSYFPLLLTILLLLILLVCHFRQPLLEQLRDILIQTENPNGEGTDDKNSENGENDENNLPADPTQTPEDAPNALGLGDDNGTDTDNHELQDNPTAPSVDTPSVSAPQTPTIDTPATTPPTVNPPTVSEPTVDFPVSEQNGGLSGSRAGDYSDLENLELELLYGDSLTY